MRFFRNRKAQSMLEYAILLGVVISAILLMQAFVKRGVSGQLKDAADKMGDQYSATNTTISQERGMFKNQDIVEETATSADDTKGIGKYVLDAGGKVTGTLERGVYSLSSRTGGDTAIDVKQQTDSAAKEIVRWTDVEKQAKDYGDFTPPFTPQE